MRFRSLLTLMLFLTIFVYTPASAATVKTDDHVALAGLKSAKVIFDVRVADLEKLVFNLELLNETWEGLVAQGVKPEMVIAFRGPGVKLLTTAAIDEEALDLIQDLTKKGVRLEACAVALRIFKVDPETLLPEVKLVGNVLNSLIGYQNKGYAMIAIN